MKNALKFFGITVLIAVIGFSMVACGDDAEDITIIITDIPATLQGGWEAYIALTRDAKEIAWAMPLMVNANVTSLSFSMLNESDDKPFNETGTYSVVLWFEKTGEDDVDYIRMNQNIIGGGNTISLNLFTKL